MAKICRIIPLRTPCNVSVNSVDQGDNSGEEMVDRSGHTQRTSDLPKKTEAEYLERAEESARRLQESLPAVSRHQYLSYGSAKEAEKKEV